MGGRKGERAAHSTRHKTKPIRTKLKKAGAGGTITLSQGEGPNRTSNGKKKPQGLHKPGGLNKDIKDRIQQTNIRKGRTTSGMRRGKQKNRGAECDRNFWTNFSNEKRVEPQRTNVVKRNSERAHH